MNNDELYRELAASAVRGRALREGIALPSALTQTPLDALTDSEIDQLLALGRTWGMKLYRFKRGREQMPRVKLVLGYLRGIMPQSLLDVGSGRGVFLFPMLNAFPDCSVIALDLLPKRVEFLEDVHLGGVARLNVLNADISARPIPEKSVDVATLLEVLEHIPDVQSAVSAAVAAAKRYVIVSVPSKADENPEHIHLLEKPVLTELFRSAGCTRLHFSGVQDHLVLLANVEEEHGL